MTSEIFDTEELLEDIDGDWEFLRETVDMLREDGPKLIEVIRTAAAQSDPETVWRNAHAVKSMVGNFAAVRAFNAADGIETRGRAGELDGLIIDVDKLDHEISSLVTALDNLLTEHGS